MHTQAQRQAIKIVGAAMSSHLLPRLSETIILCADCKTNRANIWEHRDYSFPLYVRPVCAKCNVAAGSATISSKPPSMEMFYSLLKLGHRIRTDDLTTVLDIYVDAGLLKADVKDSILLSVLSESR